MKPKKGDLIELIEMKKDPDPIKKGTKGTVINVDPHSECIHVKWEGGRDLGVIPEIDLYRVTHSPGETGCFIVESEGDQIFVTLKKDALEKLIGADLFLEDLEMKSHKVAGESQGTLSFFLRSLRLAGELKSHDITLVTEILERGIDPIPDLFVSSYCYGARFEVTYQTSLNNVSFEIK